MAPDRVSALPRLSAARPAAVPPPPGRTPPDPGRILRLLLATNLAGELEGRGEQGQVYRLFGAGAQPGWREGQTLLVQVLRTGPPLEVRVLGVFNEVGAQPAGEDADVDLPAVRPDQAAILRLAAAATDSMALAAHWRQLTLAALRQASTVAPRHTSLATPPPTPGAAAAAPHDTAQLLRLLPWHGWPLTLWLEQRRWSGEVPNRRARRRAGTRLCLALDLPPWGSIGLVLDALDVQVGLTVLVADAAAVAPLRNRVGAISARLGRAGLRLMRCHVRHMPDFVAPTAAAPATTLAEHELPLALFRAGAEALEALRRGAKEAGTG